jgi:hypothetical protein
MFTKFAHRIGRAFVLALLVMLASLVIAGPTFAQGPTGKGNVTKPKPPAQAKSIAGTTEWDTLAAGAAQSLGFKNYVYEAWELPATSTWDETFKYYNDQMKQAGWSGDGVIQDITGGKVGAWVDATAKTGLVIIFVASPDGTKPAYDFAIFGVSAPTPKGNTTWTRVPANSTLDKSVAGLAQTIGFTDYVYDAFTVSTSTTWDDVLKYYNEQMTSAGWSGQGASQQIDATTTMGVFVDPNSKSGLVILGIADPNTPVVVAVFGWVSSSSSSSSSASSSATSSASSSASSSATSSASSSATSKTTPKPAAQPNAKAATKTTDWDKVTAEVAKLLGFSNYVYEAWELPASTTWNDTFKYYSDQLASAGWSGQGVTQEFTGGTLGVFVDTTTKTGIVIFFIASPDNAKPAYALAIFGN